MGYLTYIKKEKKKTLVSSIWNNFVPTKDINLQ